MSKVTKKRCLYVLGVLALIAFAMWLRYASRHIFHSPAVNHLRSGIYVFLFSAWCYSIWMRIVQTQVRRYLLAISVLMVLWIASGDRMSSGQRTDGLYYEVTGIHPDAVLMRINGEDISAEEYLYWLAYDCEYLTSYVPNLDFSAEVSNGMTYGSYAKADAVETVKLYALLRQWAKQYNVSLTEEDEARLQQQRQQYVTYYGGEEGYQQQLQLLGISEDTFDSINRMYLLYARLHDLYTADGSAMHPTQEAIDAFAQEKGYVTVKLLYWPASGGENSQAQAEDFAAAVHRRG